MDAMPAVTWEQFVEVRRELKLSDRMVKAGMGGPLPKRSGDAKQDAAKWEEAGRRMDRLYERERAKGLPKLTAAELADARQEFAREQTVYAKLKLPHNTPYAPLMQLRRDDFPELPWPAGKDLFQLLWCPRAHFEANRLLVAPTSRPRKARAMRLSGAQSGWWARR